MLENGRERVARRYCAPQRGFDLPQSFQFLFVIANSRASLCQPPWPLGPYLRWTRQLSDALIQLLKRAEAAQFLQRHQQEQRVARGGIFQQQCNLRVIERLG